MSHRSVDEDPKTQEFQADAFAVKVCERLEFEPFPLLSNPYTRTGAGASLMLLALEILRAFEGPDGNGGTAAETHPTASDRIAKISARNLVQPKQLEMDQEFNGTVSRVMGAVDSLMHEAREAGGNGLVSKIRQQLQEAEMEMRDTDCPSSEDE